MPQELLRDVLRTGDSAGRARRHWSVLPLSIAGHALVVTIVLISPLVAQVEMPPIASPMPVASFMRTMAPPSPPPPTRMALPQPNRAVPLEAPTGIVAEREEVRAHTAEGGLAPGPGVDTGALLTGLGPSTLPPPAPLPAPPAPRPVRVGQGIRQPTKIVHVTPEYPSIARTVRVEGTVILEAVLDVTGRVERLRVLKSVGLLDNAAIQAVQQWRYTPTELNGVPVPVLMTITVQFSLR